MDIPGGSLFLGFDSSTQGLKVVVLQFNASTRQLEHKTDLAVNYDQDLPHYKTSGGVHRGQDGLTVTAPTLMWIEALDLLFDKCKTSGIDFSKVVAISGSGQQHGSVYWGENAFASLASLSASQPLHSQLAHAFSVPNSPIWMDSSTTSLCREMENLFPNGAHDIAQKTGSRAYERFTLSQIAKVCTVTQ
jgi:xylulokinase